MRESLAVLAVVGVLLLGSVAFRHHLDHFSVRDALGWPISSCAECGGDRWTIEDGRERRFCVRCGEVQWRRP